MNNKILKLQKENLLLIIRIKSCLFALYFTLLGEWKNEYARLVDGQCFVSNFWGIKPLIGAYVF